MARSPSAATDGEELTANFTFAIPDKPAVTPVGLDEQLNKLLYGLLKPIQAKGLFRNMPSFSGALLYGPPGTGKTLLAQQAARMARINCVSLQASQIHSKFCGISEKYISRAFEEAKRSAPSIIIVDELDCIFPSRGSSAGDKNPSVLAQLLTALDKVRGHHVALVATTNL